MRCNPYFRGTVDGRNPAPLGDHGNHSLLVFTGQGFLGSANGFRNHPQCGFRIRRDHCECLGKNRVTPQWLALVDAKDSNLGSTSWWLNFDPHLHGIPRQPFPCGVPSVARLSLSAAKRHKAPRQKSATPNAALSLGVVG